MPRDIVPKREGPKEEISTPIEKHDRVFDDNLTRDINKFDAAEDTKVRTQAESRAKDFKDAQERLSKLTYVQVMDFITAMPVGMQELYLLAEESTSNRVEVLRYFPKPGVRARERWFPQSLVAVDA
jgi:hypothetical protein